MSLRASGAKGANGIGVVTLTLALKELVVVAGVDEMVSDVADDVVVVVVEFLSSIKVSFLTSALTSSSLIKSSDISWGKAEAVDNSKHAANAMMTRGFIFQIDLQWKEKREI